MKSKKDLPTISFVTPCYNDGDTIGQMIDSIADQDYPNIEHIVVNDGSTDKTAEVLKEKQKQYKNLKVIEGTHEGACHARNTGAKEATGEYLSFLPADAILYPGVVRIWIDNLLETKADFLYGGYRFVQELNGQSVMEYFSRAFDEYALKVANYIDGSFPLKKSLFDKMRGWDTNIKSLQDWDFWLNAVLNHKAKAHYMREIFFETTLPHKGGLSDDSNNNWLERTRQIKQKYNIPDKPICVTSPGAGFHGERIAKVLDADFRENPSYKEHDYDLIYLLGFYPLMAEQCASVFIRHNGLRVVHWIGSDVLQMQHLSTAHKRIIVDWVKNNVDLNLTEFKQTQKELADEGIKSKILPLPPAKFYPITDLPKKFTIAVYMPQVNRDMYLPELVERITQKCRKVNFKIFGDPTDIRKKGNVEFLGKLDEKGMAKLIDESSALMRILPHDGLSISVEEFLCAGRRVITNIPEIKGAYTVPIDIEEIAKTINEISALKKPDTQNATYWKNKLSHKKFKQFFDKLLEYDPKDYWEDRAVCWDELETKYNVQVGDKDVVLKELRKLKPKSILDIGCGNGNWAKIIKKEFPDIRYKGIDISKKMVNLAKANVPEAEFEVGDVRNLKDEQYDLIFAYTCFLHVPPEDMEETVKNLAKISKKILMVEPTKKAPKPEGYRQLPPEMIEEIERGNLILHPRAIKIHAFDDYFNIKRRKILKGRELMIADL